MTTFEHATEIDKFMRDGSPSDAVHKLLTHCLGRILLRIAESGGAWQEAVSLADFRHICDWLTAAVADGSHWLARVDELGRPKKLMKLSTVKGILGEADKSMLAFAQRNGKIKLEEGQESLWLDLENGYVIVKLLTPTALDRESGIMQHCIGSGGYDNYLRNGDHVLLSLRDTYGKPHATIEVEAKTGKIIQLQGKQNRVPERRYLAAMKTAFLREDFNPSGVMEHLELVLSPSGEFLDKYSLPAGAEILGDLDYRYDYVGRRHHKVKLPDHLTVRGSLTLSEYSHRALPSGLTVHGSFKLLGSSVMELPSDIVVHGDIEIDDAPLRRLPDGLDARGDFKMKAVSLDVFPASMAVAGSLTLDCVTFSNLPASLRVNGGIVINECAFSIDHGFATVSDLTLSKCNVGSLPEGLTVGGTLDLCETSVHSLPATANITGDLHLFEAKIEVVPAGWVIGGAIEAGASSLQALPGRTTVLGNLNVDETAITALDDLRFVSGDLRVAHTALERLPDGLRVQGDLDGTWSAIKTLPSDIQIDGRLVMVSSKITSIPEGLSVGGACDLSNTQVDVLPEGFSCGRYLDINMTRVNRLPNGLRAGQVMCDALSEIGDDVLVANGIILTSSSEILNVDEMRYRLAQGAKAA